MNKIFCILYLNQNNILRMIKKVALIFVGFIRKEKESAFRLERGGGGGAREKESEREREI